MTGPILGAVLVARVLVFTHWRDKGLYAGTIRSSRGSFFDFRVEWIRCDGSVTWVRVEESWGPAGWDHPALVRCVERLGLPRGYLRPSTLLAVPVGMLSFEVEGDPRDRVDGTVDAT